MLKLIKKLFCVHSEKECITNLHGDYINHYNCRSIYRCNKCGKQFKSMQLNSSCEYVNFKRKAIKL